MILHEQVYCGAVPLMIGTFDVTGDKVALGHTNSIII